MIATFEAVTWKTLSGTWNYIQTPQADWPEVIVIWTSFLLKDKRLKFTFLRHVRLVCDICCAHGYLYRCASRLFCFRKLKSRWLIFLINCQSNLTINIVSRAKKMRNKWWTMSTLPKENVFFIPSFHLASSLLLKDLKLTYMIETNGIGKKIS